MFIEKADDKIRERELDVVTGPRAQVPEPIVNVPAPGPQASGKMIRSQGTG